MILPIVLLLALATLWRLTRPRQREVIEVPNVGRVQLAPRRERDAWQAHFDCLANGGGRDHLQ